MGTDVMKLVLLRHGEAERQAARDELRRLTPRGQQEADATGAALAALALPGPCVYCSPYLRARETAERVAVALGVAAPLVIPGVTPDDDPRRVMGRLEQLLVPGTTPVVVTHMPFIGLALAWLTEASLQSPPPVVTAGGALLRGRHFGPGQFEVACRLEPGPG